MAISIEIYWDKQNGSPQEVEYLEVLDNGGLEYVSAGSDLVTIIAPGNWFSVLGSKTDKHANGPGFS
jgi:hypothetical protein